MGGQPFALGPFVGGLNNISTSGESKDNELVELVNMDVALDTSVTSRAPMEAIATTSLVSGTNLWDVLGIYRNTATDWYLIINKPINATDYEVRAVPLGDFTQTTTLITTTLGLSNKFVAYAQYADYGYFNVASGATSTGGRWKVGVGYSAISTMPKGRVLIPWRDRLWVTNTGQSTDGNRVWFSMVDATGPHPETWTVSTDFFDVGPGSGGLITALQPLAGYLEIFKEGATWRFSFRSAPKDGIQEIVSASIGCAAPYAVVPFENYCFVYSQGRIYKHINQFFDQVNLNVKFSPHAEAVDATAPGVDLSIMNRRLIVRAQTSLYAYLIDTGTWSQWNSFAGTPGRFYELPVDTTISNPSSFVAASRGTTQLVGSNLISTTAVSLTKIDATFPQAYMNSGNNSTDYNVPCNGNQQFTLTGTCSSTDTGATKFTVNYNFLLRNGSTSTVSYNAVAGDIPSFSKTVTAPDTAIALNVSIQIASTSPVNTTVTFNSQTFKRSNVSCGPCIFRMTEQYQNVYANTTQVEYIKAYAKTKAYNFQAASVFKRLVIWGADVKTNRSIDRWAIPLGKSFNTTWDQLESYTWDQLEPGTWNNPLSFLNVSYSVFDTLASVGDISENQRFFMKAPKSLRFRQIQFALGMTTWGNSDTGPCKLFSLTVYVAPKELQSAAAM